MLAHADRHELLTVKEVASRLRLHPMTVRRMIEEGAIPAVQLAGKGTSIRIDAAELETRLCPQSSTVGLGSSVDAGAESAVGPGSSVDAPAERVTGPPEGARQSSPARLVGEER
jgi:excisionase family DNA binding protein